jgi:CBS domain-containing protein
MTTVAQLLQIKGHDVWSIAPDASVFDAITLMAQKEIGAVLVVEERRLVGILSERDYARKIILQGRSSRDTAVRTIMTDKVFYVRPDQTLEDCMALMTARRIRHLPVLDGERLLGVVSIGDVVKSLLSEQEVRIQQLEQYITGR